MRVMNPRLISLVAASSALALAGVLPQVPSAAASFTVRPGANQVEVIGATPGDSLQLKRGATVVGHGTVDRLGSFEWRQLVAGPYTVVDGGTTTPVVVPDYAAPPPARSFYTSQTVAPGFGYLTTRDGTTLSVNVVLPGPASSGPYPTVVEYSGYDPSNPGNTTMSQLFNALGFAYVGVNIRGTGCSGGSFFNFEPIQSLDGYDAIETIASQSWVKGGTVGMVGISYPGISQLYVARTDPPHLSAIAPLSVMDDTYRGTLYPGGMLNTGFAVPWAAERASQSAPYGESWTKNVDATCDANQQLRLQNPDPLAMVRAFPYRTPSMYDQISPAGFVGRINVPVYLAGAWQDEQTGGHFPDMIKDFTTKQLYVAIANGSHIESLANLQICNRMIDFLDLYVARKVPNGAGSGICPIVASSLTGVSGMKMPVAEDLFNGQFFGKNYAQALKIFQAQKRIRILFEDGAAAGEPSGSPVARYEASFASWPPPARATTWFLGPKGTMKTTRVTVKRRPRSFSADPKALPTTTYTGSSDGIWAAHPSYHWKQIPHGKGLGWITPKLTKNVVMAGTGSVNLFVKTAAKDVDLEVTLTEVRPDGKEVYVQSGYLRGSHRKLSPTSTALLPVPTYLKQDSRAMPRNRWTKMRVEIFPFAHAFRKGSKIRLTVDAPGDDRPLWAFQTIDTGQRVSIATDPKHRSQVVLPIVGGVTVPAGRPACGSLRSQPCRSYP